MGGSSHHHLAGMGVAQATPFFGFFFVFFFLKKK